jgi:hypothetical protein
MKKLFAFLTIGLLVFAVACGGDDDDDSAPAVTGSGGASTEATTATDEDDADDADSSSSSDSVGSVTIGDETWNIVASVQCSMETVENGLPVISIAGHAEGDESVEITIDFDPRDTGLQLAVTGEGGDPSWMANEDMVVSAGAVSISGEGTFTGGGETVDGSFEAMC